MAATTSASSSARAAKLLRFFARIGVCLLRWPCGHQLRPLESKVSRSASNAPRQQTQRRTGFLRGQSSFRCGLRRERSVSRVRERACERCPRSRSAAGIGHEQRWSPPPPCAHRPRRPTDPRPSDPPVPCRSAPNSAAGSPGAHVGTPSATRTVTVETSILRAVPLSGSLSGHAKHPRRPTSPKFQKASCGVGPALEPAAEVVRVDPEQTADVQRRQHATVDLAVDRVARHVREPGRVSRGE